MTPSYTPEMDTPDAPAAPAVRGANDYLRWFLRRFWIFLITLVGGGLLGLYLYSVTPPTYQSLATIEILRVKRDAADIAEDENLRMTASSEMLSVVERLRLPHIYTEAAKGPLFAERGNIAPEEKKFPWRNDAPLPAAELTPEKIGSMLGKWVTVRWRRDTALLDLHATHTDPEIARDTLISVISAYEALTENRTAGSSEYALEYIMKSSSEIKENLLSLDSALRLYERCSEMSKEVEQAELQIVEMEKRYLPKWPALAEARELQRILMSRFSTELDQVIRLSEEERAHWEKSLKGLTDLSEDEMIHSKRLLAASRMNVLQSELDAEKQIYDNLIIQLKEGNLTRGFESRQFEVVQPPTLPAGPGSGGKSKMLLQYAGGGAALGLGIILLLGFLDPTVRTVAELEHLTGFPVIAALPAFKEEGGRSGILALEESGTNSLPAEAIRTLRAGLTFLGAAEERCSFLITSSIPSEGKSWVASNLALSFARQGDKTLLIDADLRRPVQSEVFGYAKESKGLSDQLSLGIPIKDLLLRCEVSPNLFLLPAGSWTANPSELLSGKTLRPLFEKLSEYFDRIVIDSAPLVPVSDSIPLAKLAQSVVLVTRVGKTPKGAINRSLRILGANASHPVGLVANGLPRTKTPGGHGYYYSYASGGSYVGYAQNGH